MFAINHAAASLLFKKKYPEVNIIWLLLSVQLVEFLWVILNYLGFEYTTTEQQVRYIGHIHLIHMPFSHSLISSLIIALLSFILLKFIFQNNKYSLAIPLAILSHIFLDIITHARDIPLTFMNQIKIGTELYVIYPYLAFILELAFGVLCWWYFKGSKKLLYIIILFNMFNFTLFSPDVVGLEKYFVNQPVLLTTVILFQILLTLSLVGIFSKTQLKIKHT